MGTLNILLFSTPTFRSEGRKKIPHNSEKELQGIGRELLSFFICFNSCNYYHKGKGSEKD